MSRPINDPFETIQALVAGDDFLRPAVMDLQVDDGTLVVMVNLELPIPFIESILKSHWKGPLEVYCASDLMTGALRSN